MSHIRPGSGGALIVVDVQADFLPGGALAVPDGDAVVPAINEAIERCSARGVPVFASACWHPLRHCSFVEHVGIWPVHCVAGTPGAQFAAGLALPTDAVIVRKATQESADAYSAFAGTGLHDKLHQRNITRLFVAGLATDYCVLNTVKDALACNVKVVLLVDAIRAIDPEQTGPQALQAMTAAGATLATVSELD